MIQGFSKAADPTSPRRVFHTPWEYLSSYFTTNSCHEQPKAPKGEWIFVKLFLLILILLISFIFFGCSVYMAANQPEKKDISILKEGTDRAHIIAECGIPLYSEIREGNRVDVYSFVQGYSAGDKTGRAFIHGIADVLTLGLWEVVGTPIESLADGTEVKIEVCYDQESKVDFITVFKGEEYFNEESGTNSSNKKINNYTDY